MRLDNIPARAGIINLHYQSGVRVIKREIILTCRVKPFIWFSFGYGFNRTRSAGSGQLQQTCDLVMQTLQQSADGFRVGAPLLSNVECLSKQNRAEGEQSADERGHKRLPVHIECNLQDGDLCVQNLFTIRPITIRYWYGNAAIA